MAAYIPKNAPQPIPASTYEAYASPWNFGAAQGSDVNVAAVKAAGFVQQGGGPISKWIVNRVQNADGTWTVFWSDGTITTEGTPNADYSNMFNLISGQLLALGMPQSFIDGSKDFIISMLKDGLDAGTAVNQFLYLKNYTTKSGTTLTSPYYTTFGKFNEGLDQPYAVRDLVNWVLGMKALPRKYGISSTYLSDDNMSKLIKNGVSVKNMDTRISDAQLRGITADPYYVAALTKLGYISGPGDGALTGFFLNPDIAQVEFEKRAKTTAFGTEALRLQTRQMAFDEAFVKQQAAAYAQQGYSEAQIADIASKGYAKIGTNIEPAQKLYDIYTRNTGEITKTNTIQNVLQQQEFNNVINRTLQTAGGMEQAAFQGGAGTSGTSMYLRKTSQMQPGSETPFQY